MQTSHPSNRSEKGQSLVLFALALVILMAFIALSLDGGMVFAARSNSQTSTDSAAFAAGLAIAQKSDWKTQDVSYLRSLAKTAALDAAKKNGFANDGKTNWITVNYPPLSGAYINDKNYVQVLIRSRVPTSFLQMVSTQVAENTTEAVVHIIGSEGGNPLGGGNVLNATDKTACSGFDASNNTKIYVQGGGGIFVNSSCTSGTKALHSTGSAVVSSVSGVISTVGGYLIENAGAISPTPKTGAAQQTYGDIPVPDCTQASNFGNASGWNNRPSNYTAWQPSAYQLKPGVYPGGMSLGNGMSATLAPGLYCFNGDVSWQTSGTISAEGVIFVFNNVNFSCANGSPRVQWTANNSGLSLLTTSGKMVDFRGMLVVANPSNNTTSKTMTFGGGNSSYVRGTIYAPNILLTYGNGTYNFNINTEVFARKIVMNGGSSNNFYSDSSYFWRDTSAGGTKLELAQ